MLFFTIILMIFIIVLMVIMYYFYKRLQRCCKEETEESSSSSRGSSTSTSTSNSVIEQSTKMMDNHDTMQHSQHTHQPGIYRCPISGKSFGPNDAIDVVINNRHIPVCSMECKEKIKDIAVLLTMN